VENRCQPTNDREEEARLLDNVRIEYAEMTVTITPEDSGASAEHAAGLCHADHDPAYGNGIRLRHSSPSSDGFVSVGMDVKSVISPQRRLAARSVPFTRGRNQRKSYVFEVEAWDGAKDR
jgi:hypothetical protein